MYEEYTYEYIMSELMENKPDGVDTSEGSFYWNALSKAASKLADAYDVLSDIYANEEVDTADLDHLIARGSEMGCAIEEATAGTFHAVFNIALDIGTELEAPDTDFTYVVTSLVDDATHKYLITSEDEGVEPNTYLSDVEPVDVVDGFETGTITEVVTAGTAQEDTEVYRERLLNYYESKPFAGNKAYYKDEVDAMTGVGGCKVSRVSTVGGKISLVIISSDYTVPSSTLISTVQEAVDPTASSGSGEGLAPIGAQVTVSGVASTTVNITAKFTYSSGISYSDIQSYVEAAVDAYFKELGKTWEASTTALVVRLSQLEIRFLEISGITDVEDITLNGTGANLTLADNTVPVRGTITAS